MTTLDYIGSQILSLPGVTGFLILSPNGRVAMANNVANPETMAASIAFTAMNSVTVKRALGLSKLLRLLFLGSEGEDLLVLPMRDHLAAIVKSSDAGIEEVATAFHALVKNAPR